MKGLIKKVRENKKGFTLAELLVVVAIVGILVAISIPVFTAQLSKARKATNQANLRAAKAAAVAQYMTDEMDTNATDEVIYDYDLATGTVKSITDSDSEYIVKDANKKEIDTEDGSEQYKKINVKIEPQSGTKGTINGAEITLYAVK